MKVLVLGAGVVGVATAYALARAGHRVAVVDRQPGAGLETSFANGGQVTAAFAHPWADPSAPARILKWLWRSDSPLLFRPRLDPAQWSWILRFLANCTAARARINTERALRVALYSRSSLDDIVAETGIAFHRHEGLLHIYRVAGDYDRARTDAAWMSDLGCRRLALDAAACVALEPALEAAGGRLVGGILSPDDGSGDAHLFTQRLARVCEDLGVRFVWQTPVKRLRPEAGRIVAAETTLGPLTADAYVVSLGSYSPLLLRPLGLRLPVYPAKGYSVTLDVTDPGKAPAISITDDEKKLVYSRLGDRLRVAGTAELAGYDTSIRPERTRPILNAALELFPGCGDPDRAELWAGLRPTTPDSVPVLGPTRYANLFLNTGHGTLGWTMSAGSGRIVADLVGGKTPAIDLDGLTIDRFH